MTYMIYVHIYQIKARIIIGDSYHYHMYTRACILDNALISTFFDTHRYLYINKF